VNTSELIKALAAETGQTQTQARLALDALSGIIILELQAGGEVTLPNVGKFTVKGTAARTGRNPKNGDTVAIPAGKKAIFKAAKPLKDALK
jgi:DNA-binding protein HU-beta